MKEITSIVKKQEKIIMIERKKSEVTLDVVEWDRNE